MNTGLNALKQLWTYYPITLHIYKSCTDWLCVVVFFPRNLHYLKTVAGKCQLWRSSTSVVNLPVWHIATLWSICSTVIDCSVLDWACLASCAAQSQHRSVMATLSSPLRVCRGILKELRAIQGPSYKRSLAYNYVMDQFRKNKASFPPTAFQLTLAS